MARQEPPPDAPLAPTPIDAGAPATLDVAGPVTVLRLVGRNAELELSPEQASFTMGGAASPAVDLTLDDEGVSRLHAVVQRKGSKLRILDQHSTNGTFFRGRRDPDFEVAAGDVFEVTRRIKLLALDEHLRMLRPRLLWVLGLRAHVAADDAIEAIASNAPLLLIGPAGCEQRAIAEEIHRRSPFRARDFVTAGPTFATREEQDAKLAHGDRSTIYLDLCGARDFPLPGHFVSHLFGGGIRPIVAAATEAQARKMLDIDASRLPVLHRLRTIHLAPLSARREDVPRLLDRLILQASIGKEQQPLPVSSLGAESMAGLMAYDWPSNFAGLRRAVPRLHALLTHGNKLRPAARALGLKSASSLCESLQRIGVRVSLADGDEVPIEQDDAPGAHPADDLGDDLPTPPGAP